MLEQYPVIFFSGFALLSAIAAVLVARSKKDGRNSEYHSSGGRGHFWLLGLCLVFAVTAVMFAQV